LRYESVIHEFDPWFNYRSTIKLVSEGFYEFWNWFDSDSWHPLGRVVGGTVYPGIMITAAAMYNVLTRLTASVKLRDVCVLTGPFFAGNTVRSSPSIPSAVQQLLPVCTTSVKLLAAQPDACCSCC
jgi:dolichyl-diphosphooligosaccharide--protein glycosyltransferase